MFGFVGVENNASRFPKTRPKLSVAIFMAILFSIFAVSAFFAMTAIAEPNFAAISNDSSVLVNTQSYWLKLKDDDPASSETQLAKTDIIYNNADWTLWEGSGGWPWHFYTNVPADQAGASGKTITAIYRNVGWLQNESGLAYDGLVDMKVTFTSKWTYRTGRDSVNGGAEVWFDPKYINGWHIQNMPAFDMVVTFYKHKDATDGSTGERLNINGTIWTLGQSLDEGEGFLVQGSTAGYVSNDAPVSNPDSSRLDSRVSSNSQWHSIPGSALYEIGTQGSSNWYGFIGAPVLYSNDTTNWQQARNDPLGDGTTHAGLDSNGWLWQRYHGLNFMDRNGQGTDYTTKDSDDYNNTSWKYIMGDTESGLVEDSFKWRSGAVEAALVDGTVTLRHVAISTPNGNPAASLTNDLRATDRCDLPGIQSSGMAADNGSGPYGNWGYGDDWGDFAGGVGTFGFKWFTQLFAPATAIQPPDPVKTVDKTTAPVGDTLTYTITQQINKHSSDAAETFTYKSVVFADTLPVNTQYTSFKVIDSSGRTLLSTTNTSDSNSKGTLSVTNNRAVTYTFAKNYLLNELDYNGGDLTFIITAKILPQAAMTTLTNDASVTFNNEYELKTNEVKTKVPGLTVHYMWKGVDDSSYTEKTAAKVTDLAYNAQLTAKSFADAGVTVTTGCSANAWGINTSETQNPSYTNLKAPGLGAFNVTSDLWLYGTETRDPLVNVHYMWKPVEGSWSEVATESVASGGNHTTKTETQFKALENVTPTAGCTWKGYARTNASTPEPTSNFTAVSPGSALNNITSDVWVWATEDRNPVSVHYMWKPVDGSWSEVSTESVSYGANHTTKTETQFKALDNVTPTAGCTWKGYARTNASTPEPTSNFTAVSPGSALSNITSDVWVWATEDRNPVKVHYMWKPVDGSWSEVATASVASGGNHTTNTEAQFKALDNVTVTTGCTWKGYAKTDARTPEPTSGFTATAPGSALNNLTSDVWVWATEDRNPVKVHYMWKPVNGSWSEVATENVNYGANHTSKTEAQFKALDNVTPTANCTWVGYGRTSNDTAPNTFGTVTPGNAINNITSDVYLWATENYNPVKVHYMWKPVNGDWNEVATENVTYGTNHISKTQSAFTGLSGVTVTTGCTWKGYGKTDSNAAPTAFNAVSAGSTLNNLTKDVWLWATEDWNTVKVHYMWKPISGDWNEVATENVTYNTNHTTKTEAQFKNLSGVTVTTGCTWKGYGKTDSNAAPSSFNTTNPGSAINNITKDVWLWATEDWITVNVHYMWKPVAGSWSEVATEGVTYNTAHTAKTQAQFTGLAGVTVTTGCDWMGYGKTENNTAPSTFNTASAGSSIGKITKDVWLWATEDWSTVKVHYMWKPVDGSWSEVSTDSLTYNTNHSVKTQDQFKNLNNVTFTTGCAWQGYGKTDNNTAPSKFDTTNPGSSLNNVKADVWLWATEDWTSVAVHYMWKPANGSWNEVATESVIYNRNHTVKTEEQFTNLNGVTVTTGHSWQGYTKTDARTPEPTEFAGTAPGSSVNNIIADIWLWASEKINTYPVHYMYSTGPDDPFKEVKLVENVPYGDYTTLKISDLDVTPKYPQLVNAYGKTVTNVVPGNLTEIPPSTATPVISETWFWAQESPLINGSQVTTYKWSNPAPNTLVEVGQEIEYQLTHTNTGAATSAYTLVRDYIPEGTEYVDGSVSEGGVYVAADKSANGKAYVEWVKFGIPSRASVQSTFKVKVLEKHPVIIRNHALTGTQDDPLKPGDPKNPVPTDKSNEVQHPTEKDVLTDPQVEIVKSSIPVPGTIVHKGTMINYTLTVKNSGGQDAIDVAVYDEVPKYTKFVSVVNDFDGTAVNDNTAVAWNIPKLEAGESVDLKFVVEVTDDTDGNIVANQATYCRNTPGIPTSPLPNTSNIVEHPVKPKNIITGSQVTTYKDSEPAPNSRVEVGQEIKYILTHKNTGATTSAYTLVRDYIPEGVEYVDGSVSEGGVYVSAEKSSSGRAYVEWVKFGIPVGGEVQSTFSVKVVENPPSIIRNHALTGTQPDPLTPGDPNNPEPELKSNEVRHTTDGTPCGPQIRIVKSCEPEPGSVVEKDSIIVYHLEVSNIGDEKALSIGVHDAIPTGTALVDFENVHNATSVNGGAAMGWNISELEAGKSTTLTFRVRVTVSQVGTWLISNQATYDMNYNGIPDKDLPNSSNIVEHKVIISPEKPENPVAQIPIAGDNIMLIVLLLFSCLGGAATVAFLRRIRH